MRLNGATSRLTPPGVAPPKLHHTLQHARLVDAPSQHGPNVGLNCISAALVSRRARWWRWWAVAPRVWLPNPRSRRVSEQTNRVDREHGQQHRLPHMRLRPSASRQPIVSTHQVARFGIIFVLPPTHTHPFIPFGIDGRRFISQPSIDISDTYQYRSPKATWHSSQVDAAIDMGILARRHIGS